MKYYEDKEYQEMCRALKKACPEIANDFQLDDMVLCPDGSVRRIEAITNMIYCRFRPDEKNKTGDLWFKPEELVRLPGQEDLQEMVIKITTSDSLNQTAFLYKWIEQHTLYANEFNDSMTKLWLIFVMHELHQKKWNPDKKLWEKE